MSTEELLKPRYLVIASFPGMSFIGDSGFSNGKIFFPEPKHDSHFFNGVDVEGYSHLFRKLEWWEHRKPEDIEPEMWLPIKGYEGYYEISSYGRVKSVIRKTERAHKGLTKYSFERKEKILKSLVFT